MVPAAGALQRHAARAAQAARLERQLSAKTLYELLERREADQMHAIRRDGNAAVHGHESTPTTALRRLKDAWRLSRWYARIVKRGSKVTTPEFVAPAARVSRE